MVLTEDHDVIEALVVLEPRLAGRATEDDDLLA